ncbi:hypothetical protein [Nostoc sp.]|uniref:hypothetical protein n=1 Tax=Nostoc sp. TaxID=1180 RepID=UPI002FF73B5C
MIADIDALREFSGEEFREDGIERLMAEYQNIEQIYKETLYIAILNEIQTHGTFILKP